MRNSLQTLHFPSVPAGEVVSSSHVYGQYQYGGRIYDDRVPTGYPPNWLIRSSVASSDAYPSSVVVLVKFPSSPSDESES